MQIAEKCIIVKIETLSLGKTKIERKHNEKRCTMPSLQVRDLPEQIYRKLQMGAKKDHRSLSQQAIITIKKGLGITGNPKERRQKLIENILKKPISFDARQLDDPVDLIREDRERQ